MKDIDQAPWYSELKAEVEAELARLRNPHDDGHAALAAERDRLESQVRGWRQSLANPGLAAAVRADIEQDYTADLNRIREIDDFLSRAAADEQLADQLVDPSAIRERLDRLPEILASENATLCNLELSQHIDRIDCYPDGVAVLRTCRLGPLGTEAIATLGFSGNEMAECEADTATPGSNAAISPVVPRRRAKLRVDGVEGPSEELRAAAEWAADPHRFAGLGEQWFESTTFRIPEPVFWYQEHAAAVLARVEGIEAAGGKVSLNKLAVEFGVTRPTFTRALKWAREQRSAGEPDDRGEKSVA